jgi:hypothetical protein
MKKRAALSALAMMVVGLVMLTTQARAGAGPQAPGGTPGAPNQGPTPIGTLQTGVGVCPWAAGAKNTPGAQATAQAGLHGKPTIYRGLISAVYATSLSLTLGDESPVTVGLMPETRITVPGPTAQGETLLIGMRVVVQSIADEDGAPVARSVMVIPDKPALTHRVGTVTAYTAGVSISIRALDGNAHTFSLTADTKVLPPPRAGELGVDALVTIIAPRDPAAAGLTATGIVVHPQEH